jgi:tetratricopeptide (TPR) repeat protein
MTLKLIVNQLFQEAVTAHQEGKLEEAEKLYREILETEPTQIDANHNLGLLLISLNKSAEAIPLLKIAVETNPSIEQFWVSYTTALINEKQFEEAESCCRKAIKQKVNSAKIYFNLGITLNELGRLEESEESYKIAIELKPEFAEAYHNLGNILKKLSRLDEAEIYYRKAIELKTNYTDAHNNLSITLRELGRLDEAETSCKKAIKLNPNFVNAHVNLKSILKYKELLFKIDQQKITNQNSIKKQDTQKTLKLNTFVSNRAVETDLIKDLYKIKFTEISKKDTGPFFGSGKVSNFNLFENDYLSLKAVEKDLIKIMCHAVGSDVFIMDSFLNILSANSGSNYHSHLGNFDVNNNLINQKYSLQYYLSVGDQNCENPGVFKLKNPFEEILPTNGMITIIPAGRSHSATYNGKKDRVMIGVNFYGLI